MRSLPRTALLLLALAIVPAAQASTTLATTRGSTLTLGAVSPTTFAAGTKGVTTLGAANTSATTTINVGSGVASFSPVLRVVSGSSASQSAFLRVRSSSGLTNLVSATIVLGSATQIVIVNGVATQSSGASVPLAAGGSLVVSINNTASVSKNAAGSLGIDVVSGPSTSATVVESWTWSFS